MIGVDTVGRIIFKMMIFVMAVQLWISVNIVSVMFVGQKLPILHKPLMFL